MEDIYKPVISDCKCDKCDVAFCSQSPDFQAFKKGVISDLFVAERNFEREPTDTTKNEKNRCIVKMEQLRALENQISDFENTYYTNESRFEHDISDKFECLNCSRVLCRSCVGDLEQRRAVPCIGSMKYYDYLYGGYEGGEIYCIQGQDVPITCPFCNTEDNRSYTMGYDHDESVRFTKLLQEIRKE
jgi:hypothetical protein